MEGEEDAEEMENGEQEQAEGEDTAEKVLKISSKCFLMNWIYCRLDVTVQPVLGKWWGGSGEFATGLGDVGSG